MPINDVVKKSLIVTGVVAVGLISYDFVVSKPEMIDMTYKALENSGKLMNQMQMDAYNTMINMGLVVKNLITATFAGAMSGIVDHLYSRKN